MKHSQRITAKIFSAQQKRLSRILTHLNPVNAFLETEKMRVSSFLRTSAGATKNFNLKLLAREILSLAISFLQMAKEKCVRVRLVRKSK